MRSLVTARWAAPPAPTSKSFPRSHVTLLGIAWAVMRYDAGYIDAGAG